MTNPDTLLTILIITALNTLINYLQCMIIRPHIETNQDLQEHNFCICNIYHRFMFISLIYDVCLSYNVVDNLMNGDGNILNVCKNTSVAFKSIEGTRNEETVF